MNTVAGLSEMAPSRSQSFGELLSGMAELLPSLTTLHLIFFSDRALAALKCKEYRIALFITYKIASAQLCHES